MITLSQEEQIRFIGWLKQEASTNDMLLRQMTKIGLPESLQKKRRAEIVAFMIVAGIMESIEVQVIE